MVCEIAQQKAFNKMCVKKIEKLKKKVLDLQEQLNEESEQRLKNKECWESVQKKYQELHNEDLIHLLHIVELKKENEKLQKKYDRLHKKMKTEYPFAEANFDKAIARYVKENDELRMERDNLRDLYHEELEKDHRPLNEVIQIIDTSTK